MLTQTYSYPQSSQSAFNPTSLEFWQNFILWLLVFSGWYVVMEPAPYEVLFIFALLFFLPGRMVVTLAMAPLIVFLLLYNLGGFASLIPVLSAHKALQFFLTSLYMAVTAMFYCFIIADRPMQSIKIIKNAYILAAIIASITGMMGYFNIAGMGEAWAPIFRAQGPFKDPNVMSTFIIPPAVLLVQGLMTGTQRRPILSALALGVILAGLFFAFSRGAWINFMLASVLTIGFTFLITPSLSLRSRIILLTVSGVIAVMAMLIFALSFQAVRTMFFERANLLNSYDAGEYGRFGNQIRSLHLAIVSPNGFGPMQFALIFGEDPHNVFLNAFASYGWLGGISYFTLIISSMVVGWRAIMTVTPWQFYAIAIYASFISVTLQGVQIDTEHWRHFYILLGMLWGVYAASLRYQKSMAIQRSPPL